MAFLLFLGELQGRIFTARGTLSQDFSVPGTKSYWRIQWSLVVTSPSMMIGNRRPRRILTSAIQALTEPGARNNRSDLCPSVHYTQGRREYEMNHTGPRWCPFWNTADLYRKGAGKQKSDFDGELVQRHSDRDLPFLANVTVFECKMSRQVPRIQLTKVAPADYNNHNFMSF